MLLSEGARAWAAGPDRRRGRAAAWGSCVGNAGGTGSHARIPALYRSAR